MGDLCSIVGVLLFVLLIITLVGHCIWVIAAWIIRRLMRSETLGVQLACPRCGEGLRERRCLRCGWTPWSAQPTAIAAIDEGEITARQLRKLYAEGAIDAVTLTAVMKALNRAVEAEQATSRQAASPASPPPIPQAIAVGRMEMPVVTAPGAYQRDGVGAAEPPIPVSAVEPAPGPVLPTAPPRPPRKSLAEWLAAFMVESNIRWGELVGGLLIIGCSVALVSTFWTWIAAHPIAKFGIFTAVTSAMFGAGLYSEHRWKLPNTSRGILLVATLLVPLNFLAIVGLSQPGSMGVVERVVEEVISLGLFGWLVWLGGRVLVPEFPGILGIGLLGVSMTQIAIHRLAGPAAEMGAVSVMLLGAMPVGFYLGTVGAALIKMARNDVPQPATNDPRNTISNSLFILLGAMTLATALTLGLLGHELGDFRWMVRRLSPLLSLCGIPALGVGLFLWQRLRDADQPGPRTAGASVAAAGSLVMIGSLAVGWPDPATLLPIALVNFSVFSAIAILLLIPAAHLPALACGVLAYVLGFHLILPGFAQGSIGWTEETRTLLRALLSAGSGAALAGLVALVSAAAVWMARLARRSDALWYFAGAAIIAILSLALVSYHGLGRVADHGATWVYLVYTVMVLGAAVAFAVLDSGFVTGRKRLVEVLAWTGSILLALTTVQAFAYRVGIQQLPIERWCIAMLVHASVLALGLIAGGAGKRARMRAHSATSMAWLRGALHQAVLVSSLAGAVLLVSSATVAQVRTGRFDVLAMRWAWLAGVWLLMVIAHRRGLVHALFQAAVTAAAAFGAIALVERRSWFLQNVHPFGDPWTWQAIILAVGALSLLWIVLRLVGRARPAADLGEAGELPPRNPLGSFDQWITGLLVIATLGMMVLAVVPGVVAELSPAAHPAVYSAEQARWHDHARGLGAWAASGLMLIVLIAGLWEQFSIRSVGSILLLVTSAAALLAARFEPAMASASALRWFAAGAMLLLSVPLWCANQSARVFDSFRWPGFEQRPASSAQQLRSVLLFFTITPILGLTLYPAICTLQGRNVVGPSAGSFFADIGNSASYMAPLAVMIVTLAGYAIRERSAGFAFSAGLVLNLAVTLGHALHLATAKIPFGPTETLRMFQFNAVASGAFAMAWLLVRNAAGRLALISRPVGGAPALLKLQAGIAAGLLLCVLVPVEVRLIGDPGHPPAWLVEGGSACVWMGWVLVGTTILLVRRREARQIPVTFVGAAILIVGSLVSMTFGASEPWLAYHALLLSRAGGAWLMLGFGWLASLRAMTSIELAGDEGEDSTGPLARWLGWRGFESSITLWSALLGVIVLVLSLRDSPGDPQFPAWTLAGLLSLSLLCVAHSFWSQRHEWLYPFGILLNGAVTIGWLHYGPRFGLPFDLIQANTLTLALSGLAALLLEIFFLRPAREQVIRRGLPAYHRFAAVVCVVGILLVAVPQLGAGMRGRVVANTLTWSSIGASIALMLACLWDIDARRPLFGLYLLGLPPVGLALVQLGTSGDRFVVHGTTALVGYSLLASYAYAMRRQLAMFAEKVRIPLREDWPAAHPHWLGAVTLIASVLVLVLSASQVLMIDSLTLRLEGATAAIAMAVAIALPAYDLPVSRFHHWSLLFGVLGLILWGWAWQTPRMPGNALDRAVIVMAVGTAASAFYAVGMVKMLRRENAWTQAARRLVPLVGGLTLAGLAFVLVGEFLQYEEGVGTPMSWWAVVAVIVALGMIATAGIVCAVVPGRDPLELPERGRTAYVYATEVALVLMFVHLRLNFPDIFALGIWKHFWPFIILMIAFLGVGLGEVFRRQRRIVLAEPLERTGAFLPLLPVIAYWMTRDTGAWRWDFSYASVMFLAGVVYAGLAMLRRSFGFGVLAALMANGGLWAVLNRAEGLEFARHPQLWLIPGAVCVLAAAQLNREQLSEQTMRILRYVCLMIIYVSSTADILIARLDVPWLPLLLAMLSVSGVMAGIALRVQSFLFLGTLFLLVAIAAMIQYATRQVHSGWPWAVAGIFLGAGIVVVFALFEKKRAQMLAMVSDLKRWQK